MKKEKPRKIFSFLELMRPTNCLIAGIAVLVGYFVARGPLHYNILLAFFSAFFICGAGQAINDFFDYKIDAKINPKKVIPSKRVTRNQALIFSLILFGIGFVLASLINQTAFFVAIIMGILLFTYASSMSRVKYIGNYVVALGTAITFVFGAISSGFVPNIIWFFFFSAFFSNVAREITKDFEDMKKDKGTKRTLPLISKRNAKISIFVSHTLSVVFGVSAFFIYKLNYLYLVILIVGTLFLIKAIVQLNKNNYSKSQSLCKKGMITSLIAFIISIF